MDNFITVADFHSGIQIYVSLTAVLFFLLSLVVAWINQKDAKKIVKDVEEKFEKYKLKTDKHLIGAEANNDRAFAMNARTEKAFDYAFLREMKAANLYSKIKAVVPANGSLFLAEADLSKFENFSRILKGDISDVAEIFGAIGEIKGKDFVDQERLLKIEKDFKIKYENSIKNQS